MSGELTEIPIADLHNKYRIQGIKCQGCIPRIIDTLQSHWTQPTYVVSPDLRILHVHSEVELPLSEIQNVIAGIGDYQLSQISDDINTDKLTEESVALVCYRNIQTFYPLLLITSYLVVSTCLYGFSHHYTASQYSHLFMGLFFLVFSFFKLLNINGFVKTFTQYDPIASHINTYGYVYPLLELLLGITYLYQYQVLAADVVTVIVFTINLGGVLHSLYLGKQLQCACMGSVLKVPLTKITIVEDLFMVLMGLTSILVY